MDKIIKFLLNYKINLVFLKFYFMYIYFKKLKFLNFGIKIVYNYYFKDQHRN